MLQILSGASAPGDLIPADSLYVLEAGKSVEISLPGGMLAVETKFELELTFSII